MEAIKIKEDMKKKLFLSVSDNFDLSNLYLKDMDAVTEYINGDIPNYNGDDINQIEWTIKPVFMTQDEFDNLPEYEF